MLEAAATVGRSGPVVLVAKEWRDLAGRHVEPDDLDTDRLRNGPGGRGEVAEQRDERIGRGAPSVARREVEAVRRGVWVEPSDRGGRRVCGVRLEEELRLRLVNGLEPGIGHRRVAGEVRKSVPGALLDAVEAVPGVLDRALPAGVEAVHRHVDRPVRAGPQSIGVPEAPGVDLELGAVRSGPQDRAVALDVAGNGRPRGRGVAKRRISRGRHRLARLGERIADLEGRAGKSNVLAGDVVEIALGLVLQPAEDRVVAADDRRVRHRADGHVHPAVLEHELIRLVIAAPREVRHDGRQPAGLPDRRDRPGMDHVDETLVDSDSGHRQLFAEVFASGERGSRAVSLDPGDLRLAATAVGALGDDHPALLIPRCHRRRVKTLDGDLDSEAVWRLDVGGPQRPVGRAGRHDQQRHRKRAGQAGPSGARRGRGERRGHQGTSLMGRPAQIRLRPDATPDFGGTTNG
jgi:hypothetical protein